MKKYPKISVIILHYNRFDCLRETLKSFISNCDYKNLEIIVSDDNSDLAVKEDLLGLPIDLLVTNYKNNGLGNNTNNAIKVASGKYILHLQDDWKYVGDKSALSKSVLLMEMFPGIELIRYYNVNNYPTERFHEDFVIPRYSELPSKLIDTLYSDTPHLKRNEFHVRYGLYKENAPMTEMEISFAKNFANKRSGDVIFTSSNLFIHIGDKLSYNPSKRKVEIYKQLNNIYLFKLLIKIYFKYMKR